MKTVTSKDGTPIRYETAGSGHPLVFCVGAFNDRNTCAGLASLLSDTSTTVRYDRRGRGASGDTAPYEIEREIEDLAAVIDAVGGSAAVFGYSSGGMIALQAAASLPISHVVAFEPPFAVPGHAVVVDLADRMQAAVDDGRPADAVVLFQTEAIGMPAQVVDQIRQSPMFGGLVEMAQSAVYDIRVTTDYATPTPQMRTLEIPVLVLHGAETWPQLAAAASLGAQAVPSAVLRAVAGGANHAIPDDTTADAVRGFLSDPVPTMGS